MLKLYSAVLGSRVAVFFTGLVLFFVKPQSLDITENFGISKGLTFVNFVWVYLICQMLIQIFSKHLGSMGFRKQFECNYKERKRLLAADRSDFAATYASAMETALASAKISDSTTVSDIVKRGFSGGFPKEKLATLASSTYSELSAKTSELTSGITARASELTSMATELPAKATELTSEITAKATEIVTGSGEYRGTGQTAALPWNGGNAGNVIDGVTGALKSGLPGYSLTDDIANVKELNKGALKVMASWLLLNAVIAGLYVGRLIDAKVMFLIMLFYGMSDLICVLLYCPFQHLMMKNKCCRTCRIFNWDGAMTVTPLVLIPCAFSLSLIALAAILLIKWEFTFARHPGRFLESKNCTLECKSCEEHLCKHKLNDKKGGIRRISR